MATIRERKRKDGSVAYNVVWKESDRKQRSRTFDTYDQALNLKQFLDANNNSFELAAQAARDYLSTAPSVAQVVKDHIDLLTHVEPGTKLKYKQIANRHIIPLLGDIPVDQLDRRRIVEWFEEIKLSAKTKRNIQAVLSAALNTAVENGLIQTNPAEGVQPPRNVLRTRQPIFLTDAQADILRAALPEWHRLLFDVLLGTGLRYSEAAALLPGDFSLTNADRLLLRVTKAWKYGDRAFYLGGPKSKASVRSVILPRSLNAPVQSRLKETPARGYVFGEEGAFRPIYNHSFHKRVWQPMLDEVTAPSASPRLQVRPGPHDLRHTHTSRLIAAGVPLPVIQKRLGHESIQTTVGVYGHLMTDADQMAADALD